jgi:hypothetical protein
MLPFEVPTDFAALSTAELTDLRRQVRETSAQYSAMELSDVTDDDVTDMTTLQTLVQSIDVEKSRRAKAGQAFAGLKFALGDESQDADESDGDAAEEEDPEEEEAPAAPAAKPKVKAPKAAAVAAAGGGSGKESVADEAEDKRTPALIVAGANIPDYSSGTTLNWNDVAKVVERRFRSYGSMGAGSPYTRDPVAQIKLDYPDNLTASGGMEQDATALLEYAADESRLPGGSLLRSLDIRAKKAEAAGMNSLTAAGQGWCAPSEVLYDLCELESADGMLDIPEINVSRGGIRYTTGPDFSSIFSGAGYWHVTEAQVISGTTKPCMPVPCPSFTDTRLDADGLCISTDLLQLRGYPELIARFVRGAMIAHAHKINMWMINQLVTNSTALVLPSGVATHTPSATGSIWATDHSVITMLLQAIDLAITDYKYRQRMRLGATLEVVLPYWVQSWIRADLSRRTFYDGDNGTDVFAISMARMNDWLKARNARVQWVYDWQDAFYWAAYTTGAPSAWQQFGAVSTGSDFVQDWPHTVQFLVYAAGTWVRGNADIITLDTVYDSTLLAQNRATQLFTEQGILAAKTCFDSRVYTVTGGAAGGLVPSGAGNYAPTAQPTWTNP